jgi:hypothetical protein
MNSLSSREQNRTAEFFLSTEPLRQIMTKTPLPSAALFYDATRETLAAFGRCELWARQAERWNAAGIRKDSANEYTQRSMYHQEIGLQSLAKSRDLIDDLEREFKKQFAKARVVPNAPDIMKRIRKDIQSEVCDLEIKASDVTKIMSAVDQALNGLNAGSWKDVLAVCRDGIAQLEKARNSPDRGTSDNQPWWKVLGIILIVGALVVAAIACLYYPPCAGTAALTGAIAGVYVGAAVVAAIGGILTSFC